MLQQDLFVVPVEVGGDFGIVCGIRRDRMHIHF